MDIDNSLRILTEDLEKNSEIELDINNNLQCEIYIFMENGNTKLILQVKNYSCKKKLNKILINQTFKTSDEALTYLHNIFNTDGSIKYSKIKDEIFVSDDQLIHDNNVELAKLYLINKESECCVCNENNTVITKCGHNLCRYCFTKMCKINNCCEDSFHYQNLYKKILCPICKREIYSYYF